jgi:hypothetical protein
VPKWIIFGERRAARPLEVKLTAKWRMMVWDWWGVLLVLLLKWLLGYWLCDSLPLPFPPSSS